MKYTDKTDDEWDDLIEEWHNDPDTTITLKEYLGLDDEQYQRLAFGIRDDSLSYEEVLKISGKVCRDVIQNTGSPIFKTIIRL